MQAFKSPTFRLARFSRLARATPLLVRSPLTSRLPSVHAPRAFSSTPVPHFSRSSFKMGGNVVEITTKEDFESKVIGASEPVLVDFFAEWCGPCKAISPAIEKLSVEHTGVKFYKVDVDKLGEVAASNEISAMPTFLFFKDGKKVDMVRGANPPAINAAVQKLLA
ncbi:uncharacterized protein N7498_008248 [Penicillium cinerascens]|uniref:Thioredoxin domain-containing protein n=1 Tax=Penicillium cinerascens TaxID=70096 RepID=A0A9W9JDB8_9EURO|nr:uncharacterized protein N7498_008248 [Penicillium cinerascens]KAJ5194810.1 hypothetical protein N7498_008248 [Penicillium cinerascens]